MKKVLSLMILTLSLATAAFAQGESNDSAERARESEQNAPVELKSGEKIARGAGLAKNVKKVSLEKALKSPEKYGDNPVTVEGVIVRSCKNKGCWMEMAAKEGGKSVRVTFGNHAFFIPLNAAGMQVKAQGVFKTKTLSKEHVDHLINDDGAKFDNRNADGTVTEVSFDATGVELTKATN